MLLLVLPSWVDTQSCDIPTTERVTTRWPAPVAAIRHKTWTWCRRDGLGGTTTVVSSEFWGIAKGGHYRKTHNTSKVFFASMFFDKTYVNLVNLCFKFAWFPCTSLDSCPTQCQVNSTPLSPRRKKHKNPWEPRFLDLRSWCVFWGAPKKQLAFPCSGERVNRFMLNHDHVTFFPVNGEIR